MASISFSGIAKAYGSVAVLRDIALAIADGEFFTLLGPSGCGKTSLLRIAAGLLQPDAGTLRFDQADVTHLPAHRRDVGMVFQDYALFPDRTVFDNVAYGLRARKLPAAEVRRRTTDYLRHVGLEELGGRHPANLSGGQRQRAALARAMVIQPRVLLMDEPLSNLDAKLRVQLRDSIRDLQRQERTTTIFVTHDQEEALAMSDRIAILDRGRIAQIGTPHDLYETPANGYVADFIGAANVVPVQDITRIDGGCLIARIAGFPIRCSDGGASQAQGARLIARPEQLSLRPGASGTAGDNAIPGHIARRQYLGAATKLQISIGGNFVLTVERPSHEAFGLEEGAAVDVLLPPSLRVVPQ